MRWWFAGAHRLAARGGKRGARRGEDPPRSEADVERDEAKAERPRSQGTDEAMGKGAVGRKREYQRLMQQQSSLPCRP